MTTDELIAKLVDVCQAFISAAKDDLHLHLINVPWKNLIAHSETVLAIARQHKGGWLHLDRDEEKPEIHSVCLTWHPEWGVRVSLIGTAGNFDEHYNPRWWMPLPAPPKD